MLEEQRHSKDQSENYHIVKVKPSRHISYRVYRNDGEYMQTYRNDGDAVLWIKLYGEIRLKWKKSPTTT